MDQTIRPRIADVAHAAGVSTATVDRVLNRRTPVRGATARRVLRAAVALDYLSQAEVQILEAPRLLEFAFLLPRGGNPYFALLNQKARSFVERHRGEVRIRSYFIDGFDPDELCRAMRRFARNADAVVFMAIDHPKVRQAVDELAAAGKKMITLISDISSARRHAFIGIDSYAAGRTAALLLGRFIGPRPGRVALIAASRIYRAHLEREVGFLGLLEERFPHLSVIGTREGHDSREENYHHARSLPSEYPDIRGVYNVGGSSDGIGRALTETGRAEQVVFIGHGLTPTRGHCSRAARWTQSSRRIPTCCSTRL